MFPFNKTLFLYLTN